jgi:general secretion pathway protein D
MSDEELYQVFLSMLQISGYAAVPSGDVIKIVPNIDAKTISPDPLLSKNPPHGDEMMVAVIPVHYVPSEQLVPVLRPLMPQWSSVSAYGPSNMLILSGRASNIKQLVRIIKQVDTSFR